MLWNVRISGLVQSFWQLQRLQTNECFKRPEENFCQRENADAQKDTWDQSKLIILIITRTVCLPLQFWVLTKPGSHVNQDFDGGPLQASFILWQKEKEKCFSDLEFVKKFTRPNFPVKEFYTLKTRKSRLFLPAINSKNASLSVI